MIEHFDLTRQPAKRVSDVARALVERGDARILRLLMLGGGGGRRFFLVGLAEEIGGLHGLALRVVVAQLPRERIHVCPLGGRGPSIRAGVAGMPGAGTRREKAQASRAANRKDLRFHLVAHFGFRRIRHVRLNT